MIKERERMPATRRSVTRKFKIGDSEGYVTAGMYDDGRLGEVFLTDIGKEGSTMRGVMDFAITLLSITLQCGVPLQDMAEKFKGMKFEPNGATNDPEIPYVTSVIDYIFRWLEMRFPDGCYAPTATPRSDQ